VYVIGRVQRSTARVRCSSGGRGVAQQGCGVAQEVQRSSVGSESACCEAGPSSIRGLAPQGDFSLGAIQ
jgi:hypothetical protein